MTVVTKLSALTLIITSMLAMGLSLMMLVGGEMGKRAAEPAPVADTAAGAATQ